MMFLASQIAAAKSMELGYQPAFASGGRRHHRQVIGSDIDADGNEHRDKADPESPIMMRAPPVRSFAVMAMVTLAVGMRVFRVVHSHADLREKHP